MDREFDGAKRLFGHFKKQGFDLEATNLCAPRRKEMLASRHEYSQKVESLLVDGGFNGKPFAQFVREVLQATVEVAKRNELHTFTIIPKRWVVERSISWVEKCRRLWKNCECKLET